MNIPAYLMPLYWVAYYTLWLSGGFLLVTLALFSLSEMMDHLRFYRETDEERAERMAEYRTDYPPPTHPPETLDTQRATLRQAGYQPHEYPPHLQYPHEKRED